MENGDKENLAGTHEDTVFARIRLLVSLRRRRPPSCTYA